MKRAIRQVINHKNLSLDISIFTMMHFFIINNRVEATVKVVPPQLCHREFLIWGISTILNCMVGWQSDVFNDTIFVYLLCSLPSSDVVDIVISVVIGRGV